jgi:hypothetical protein
MRTSLFICLVALATAGCGAESVLPSGAQAPLSPSPVVLVQPENYAGAWTVSVTLTDGEGYQYRYSCRNSIGRVGQQTMRLVQLGSRVTGVLMPDVDVTGEVGADGRLSLTGSGQIPEYQGVNELQRFDVMKTPDGGFEGDLVFQRRIPPQFEPLGGTYTSTGRIIGATRGALPSPTSFTGRWDGYYRLKSCGPGHCIIDPERELAITLRDIDGVLSGSVQIVRAEIVPVVGRADGDRADLATEGSAATTSRVAEMHVQRNAVGRLFGTLRIEYPAMVLELELLNVVLTSEDP